MEGGATPDSLAQRTLPIHVSDGAWMSGLRLEPYSADGDGELVDTDVNHVLVLELKTAQGKSATRNAVHDVTTRPPMLVLKHDSL